MRRGGGSRGKTQRRSTMPKIPTIQWETRDTAQRTARLIAWCKANPDARIKLFSDSTQEAAQENRPRQQLSTQKEKYYLQLANSIFPYDHDEVVRDAFQKHPLAFVKPLKARFHTLRKKYNEFNKALGGTGAGVNLPTVEELRENPKIGNLYKKLLDSFPWWEDLHGWWKNNPAYNTAFTTADPGQDFAAEACDSFTPTGRVGTSTSAQNLSPDGSHINQPLGSSEEEDPLEEYEDGIDDELGERDEPEPQGTSVISPIDSFQPLRGSGPSLPDDVQRFRAHIPPSNYWGYSTNDNCSPHTPLYPISHLPSMHANRQYSNQSSTGHQMSPSVGPVGSYSPNPFNVPPASSFDHYPAPSPRPIPHANSSDYPPDTRALPHLSGFNSQAMSSSAPSGSFILPGSPLSPADSIPNSNTSAGEAMDAVRALSLHAHRASGSAKGRKGKEKDRASTTSHRSSPLPSIASSSSAHKRSRDVTTDVVAKMADASDKIVRTIQGNAEAMVEAKRLKLDTTIISSELKAREGHAKREQELRSSIINKQYDIELVREKRKNMEVELELERLRIQRLTMEKELSHQDSEDRHENTVED